MDSKPRKHHRRGKPRLPGAPKASGRRRQSSVVATSSFASQAIAPSRGSIALRKTIDKGPIECKGFLWALFGVSILILFGGGEHVSVLGLALILPGIALLRRPPEHSLGKWLDLGIIGTIAALFLAFLPVFYWQSPEWRIAAVEDYHLDLPSILSVQPWMSFEGLLSVIAGFCWFYAAGSWKVNYEGRRRIYFVLSCLVAVFSVIVIYGNLLGLRYPGARGASAFSFFPDSEQTSIFIAIGGIIAFGYAMEGIRGRNLSHLVGLVATVLALIALIYGASQASIAIYFAGVVLWFVLSLRASLVSWFFKITIPAALLIFLFLTTSQLSSVEDVIDYITSPMEWSGEEQAQIFQDTLELIEDAPLTGVGLGNYSAVFPQYRNLSRSEQAVDYPENDLLWFGAEAGLLGLGFLVLLLISYFLKCRSSEQGHSGAYRLIALTAVILFLVNGFFNVSWHQPGVTYFVLLLAVLALPRISERRSLVKPVVWRCIGGLLFVGGMIWWFGAVFQLPTHSKIAWKTQAQDLAEARAQRDIEGEANAVDARVALRPLYWRGYSDRAKVALLFGEERSGVEQDFDRALFVEPTMAKVAYEEGLVWIPSDVNRTVRAWREALARATDSEYDLYERMLRQSSDNRMLWAAMVELSRENTQYHARLMLYSNDEVFERELEIAFNVDPALAEYMQAHRTALVQRWISHGALDPAQVYLQQYGTTLNHSWFLQSILRKNQARYQEAVDLMREALPMPQMPTVPDAPEWTVNAESVDRLRRSFTAASNDPIKGTALIRYYMDSANSREALKVVDRLIESSKKIPDYLYYLRAEILYDLGDYAESWYAFETYWKQLN
jgi:O-antigen ligase